MQPKTCFVIIGYGIKTDFQTGREINLDKTYSNIIEPVFKELGFVCFRASDIQHSGVIDLHMYDSILKADFVLADISTLNPNVLYELGIRHAVRKNTTLIIAEKELKYPFDLSHITIDQYEHLGKAIDYDEVLRFQKVLKDKVSQLLLNPSTDSPIYSFFPRLQVPHFTEDEISEIIESQESDKSLADILEAAEKAKNDQDYTTAKQLLEEAIKVSNDSFVLQRYALVTYKSKDPSPIDALFRAELILDPLDPENSTDPETLGLSGAINKRLFEELGEPGFLDKALRFYKRGFYIKNDYYNGINASYLMVLKALIASDQFEAYAYFGEAQIIRREVVEVCYSIISSKIWNERDDQQWVYLTLAEALYAEGKENEAAEAVESASAYLSGSFTMSTFLEQQEKLTNALADFRIKYGIG